MAINEKLNARVRAALAHLPKVQEKVMFRGVLFMVDGKMCISSGDGELMLRIDHAIYDEVIKKKGCRPMVMKGKAYKGYVMVHEDALKAKKDFDYWIGLALDFNKRAKATPKRKK